MKDRSLKTVIMRCLKSLFFLFISANAIFGDTRYFADAQTIPPVQNPGPTECAGPIALVPNPNYFFPLTIPWPGETDCIWKITAPAGQHVQLNIIVMNTNEDEQFRIYDHGTSTDDQYLASVIQGFPHIDIRPYVSSTEGLVLRYTAFDGSENIPGLRFYAQVRTVSTHFLPGNNEACGGHVPITDGSPAEIKAPYNWPQHGPWSFLFFQTRRPFRDNGTISCYWTIEAPPNQKIQVTWNKINTLNEAVGIYDHDVVSYDHEVTRIQGLINWQMPAFVSSGNVIVLYLKQDGLQFNIGEGFHVTVQTTNIGNPQPGCGGTINLDETSFATANIRSPYYDVTPSTAGSIVMCWWFVTAPYSSQVQIDVNDVTTTTNERLWITDGVPPSDDPAFEHFFTGDLPAQERLYSRTGGVTISLEDLSVAGPNGQGFSLDVSIAGPGYCEIAGDPHYISFDGLRFDFQGDCEYTLTKPCSPETDDLPDFHLWGNNIKSSPASTVSVLRQVFLSYNGSEYSIGKPMGRIVRVDGVEVTLPVSQNGVSISLAHPLVIVETDFGLRFTYDGSHFARVYLSQAFAGKVCGLCGNFDGDTGNEFTLPNDTVTNDINLWGYSWNVNEDFCSLSTDPSDNPCDLDPALADRIEQTCSIFDPNRNGGIFGDCSDYVDHANFLTSCVFDLCYTHELNAVICAGVQEYIILCQAENPDAAIGDWRNVIPQCAFECPEGTEYQMCGTACPNTCADRTASQNCPRPCHETCVCPDGLVLDGEKCVAVEDCGCTLPNNVYISSGEVWVTPETCEESCSCQGGTVTCQPLGCGQNEVCAVRNGVRGCYCQNGFIPNTEGDCEPAPAVCTISGDPHYTTFDRFTHHFQGDCMYTLVKPCQSSIFYPDFHVWGDPVKNNPADTVSWLRTVFLTLNGTTYTLGQGKAFLVDGVARSNINYQDDFVRVWSDASFLTLETRFGLLIQFNGGSFAYIKAHQGFRGNTCGLCGNFDGDNTNEYTTSDGVLTPSVDVFGNSWQTGTTECRGIVTPPNPCDVDPAAMNAAKAVCNNLQNRDGPFETCLDFADPSDIYESCVYDACVLGADDDAVCDHYGQYAQTCQTVGQPGGDWRTPLAQCVFTCPANLIYNPCGSPCPPTCADPTADRTCPTPCQESCTCPENLLLDGDRCIEREQCGCTFDGSYYPNEATWTSDDCMTTCTCVSREVVCVPNKCQPSEECTLDLGGVPGCYCVPGLNRVDGVCVGDIPPSAEIRVSCEGYTMSASVNDLVITEDVTANEFEQTDVVCGVFRYDPTSFTFEKFYQTCEEHIARAQAPEVRVIFSDVATAPLDVLTGGAAGDPGEEYHTVIFCQFQPAQP